MFTPKERLLNVLNNQTVDRPPCICPGGMMNMVTTELIENLGIDFKTAHSDAEIMAKISSSVYESGCFENYGVPFCMTIEAEDLGADVNMGSNIYEPHVIKYPIDSVSQWNELATANLDGGRSKTVIEAIEILKSKNDGVPIIGNLTGPISTASSVMEPSIFYKELRKNNEDAHKFMDFVTDQLISFAKAQIKAGADIIAISDPSGTGEILGPKLFEEFAVKYLNKLIFAIKDSSKDIEETSTDVTTGSIKTIVHICGQMKKVYPQINLVQSDVLSFDSLVSIKEAKENLPGRKIMGNVSTYTIEFGEPEKIAELTRICIKNGSDIISPACGLGMKSPLRNVQSMLNFLKKEE
ncbi:MAG: uroporphyrinogen decarboxylase family protein [Proteocatella sp.]